MYVRIYIHILLLFTIVLLTSIPRPFKVDVQMKYTSLKRTLEPFLVRILPFFVDDAKRDVFVRRTAGNFQNARVVVD